MNAQDKHPSEERQSLQDYFRQTMHTVVGQAFGAAGYGLEQRPMQWLGGSFRYHKQLDSGADTYIEFQVLVYNDNAYTGRQPSRFRVNLLRRADTQETAPLVKKTLSRLVVEDFGVSVLPSPDFWWQFHDQKSLGAALAEAGHLAIGYGIPWLAGELSPDQPDV